MSAAQVTAIRPGRASDLEQVVALERASFSDPWSLPSLRAELESDPLRFCLVAERDDRVLGYLMSWRMVDQLHILNIAVAAAARRSGIGTRLLLAAAQEAAGSGLTELTLEVRQSNTAARAFYSRLGFTEAGVRRGYYPNNRENAVVLSCPTRRLTANHRSQRRPETG